MPESTDGKWTGVVNSPNIFAVHATLMSNGNVLLFSGSVEGSEYPTESFEWDPKTNISTAERANMPPNIDFFCAHHANLEDGRVMVIGGSGENIGGGYTGDWGIKDICIYDPTKPVASRWEKIGSMTEGRWYPTLVTLPDGKLVTFSGIIRGNTHASSAELFAPPFKGPGYMAQTLTGGDKSFPSYPGMFLVKGGKIIHCGTTWQYRGGGTSAPIGTFSFVKTGPTTATWVDEGISPNVDNREEGTFVLLPPAQDGKILLIGGGLINGTVQASDSEPKAAEILDTQTMSWSRIDDMNHPRVNVSAVLLPDGKVLAIGGHDSYKWSFGLTASNIAELYDPILDTWTEVDSMGADRQYHSSALLLTDGRVLVAGGVLNRANQLSYEFYEPPYFFNGDQPTITDISRDDGPNDRLTYGGEFFIDTDQADTISKVALMRPGSITHHTDTEQRYVALNFFKVNETRLRVGVINDPSVAPIGNYMLWIIDEENRPCRECFMVNLSSRKCRIITDRSHVSRDELAETGATVFENAFYVMMDGFTPEELEVISASPTSEQLNAWAPDISFTAGSDEFIEVFTDIIAEPQKLLLEDDTLPEGVKQTFTFKYRLKFNNDNPFKDGVGEIIERRQIDIKAEKIGYGCFGELNLTNQPNPFIVDGETHWLSTDVRVFQMTEGTDRFGHSMGNDSNSAISFIQSLINGFRDNKPLANTQFENIDPDQPDSKLELSRYVDGKRVFNFAIARVSYKGRTLNAEDVRVFFRMFTTAATGLDYREGSTYKRTVNAEGDPIPVLGTRGGEVVTIPFFAQARENTAINPMSDQKDTINVKTISASETTEFFGCWLDFNQTALRFPINPGGIGPYSSGLKSIQELIRGRHQCLVAEIHFPPDFIEEGDTPASNDNLSQRNLIIVESDNPGNAATHTVQHTFEIEANIDVGIGAPAIVPEFKFLMTEGDHGNHIMHPELLRIELDELMIQWGNLPRNSVATLFIPDLKAVDIVSLTSMKIGPERLQIVDDHTIELRIGDVTYLTLPPSPSISIPALITIQLPENVKKGQEYRVSVFQINGEQRKILGTFELKIPVTDAKSILPNEIRTLSVFKHIAASIPTNNHWKGIFDRRLLLLADRVKGLGGDPDLITASPDGDGKITKPPGEKTEDQLSLFCQIIGVLFALLVALFVGLLVIQLSFISLIPLVLAILLFIYWRKACRVSGQTTVRFVIGGLLIGLILIHLFK